MSKNILGQLPLKQENFSNVEVLRACDVKPEQISWIWNGWLAAGKFHVLGGAPGSGKTTISISLAAIITNGGIWPDGSISTVGNIVFWSGEDDPKDTLIPRLMQAGADLRSVYFITGMQEGIKRRSFDPASDMEPLKRKLLEIGEVSLLIIDPIVAAIAGDSHKNAEVRRSLQPLVDLTAAMGCALLGITHFSKGTSGRDPVERITGSLAFGALARIVLVVAKQQNQTEGVQSARIFLRAKSNIGLDNGGFEYEVQQKELTEYPDIVTSSIVWLKYVEGTAQHLLINAERTPSSEKIGSKQDAMQFLYHLLSKGPLSSTSIQEQYSKAGYSEATIRRAKDALGIEAVKEGGGFGNSKQSWIWQLPNSSETYESN